MQSAAYAGVGAVATAGAAACSCTRQRCEFACKPGAARSAAIALPPLGRTLVRRLLHNFQSKPHRVLDWGLEMNEYHVVRQFGQWALLEKGCGRPLQTFISKREAFIFGMNYGADHHACVILHREDGSPQEQHTFAERTAGAGP